MKLNALQPFTYYGTWYKVGDSLDVKDVHVDAMLHRGIAEKERQPEEVEDVTRETKRTARKK